MIIMQINEFREICKVMLGHDPHDHTSAPRFVHVLVLLCYILIIITCIPYAPLPIHFRDCLANRLIGSSARSVVTSNVIHFYA